MLSAMQDVQCFGAGAAWAVAALSVSEKAARAMVPATVCAKLRSPVDRTGRAEPPSRNWAVDQAVLWVGQKSSQNER